ncbi:MAG: DHHA1 domain-containing protein [Patescibacteria group bacterium]
MNQEITKDIVVFYHGGCSDGFGSAYSAWKKFKDTADYLPIDYKENLPEIKDKKIFFLDITLQKEILKTLMAKNEVIGIDHHISTKDDIEVLEQKIFSTEKSGAYLSWEYFNPESKVPEFIKHISDYDLWEFKMNGTKEINLFLKIIPMDFESWDKIADDMEDTDKKSSIVNTGKTIATYRDNLAEKIIERGIKEVSFENYKAYCVNAPNLPELADIIGNALARKSPPFAIIWAENREYVGVSLRGDGSVDVSKLAEKYGGGGHHDAAGFRVSNINNLPWTEIAKD